MSILIHIKRENGIVSFETASVIAADLVVWVNQDKEAAHWPSLSPNQIGAAPSPNSSDVPAPGPTVAGANPPYSVSYKCLLEGHENETGTINVFNAFSAATAKLPDAKLNQPLPTPVPVATGGQSPYTINSQLFQVVAGGNIVQQGQGGVGPGLTLSATTDNTGLTVSGTPTVAGTYTFTFDATDAMGLNVQQTQFTMNIA